MSLRREREIPAPLHDTGEDEIKHVGKDGKEQVVKLRLPGLKPLGKITAETRAEEKPPTPDDPRSGIMRDVPPYGGAVTPVALDAAADLAGSSTSPTSRRRAAERARPRASTATTPAARATSARCATTSPRSPAAGCARACSSTSARVDARRRPCSGTRVSMPVLVAPDRAAAPRPPRRRAGHGPRRRGRRDDLSCLSTLATSRPTRGRGRRARRPAVVPALRAARPRRHARADRRGRRARLRRDRPDRRRARAPAGASATCAPASPSPRDVDMPAVRAAIGGPTCPTPAEFFSLVDTTLTWRALEEPGRRAPAAGARQGHPHRRGRAARRRARRGGRRRLQPRRPPARRRPGSARPAARGRRGRRRPRRGARWTAACGAAPTSSPRSRWARGPCSSAARCCGAWPPAARRARCACSRLLHEEVELGAHAARPPYAGARAAGASRLSAVVSPRALDRLRAAGVDTARGGRVSTTLTTHRQRAEAEQDRRRAGRSRRPWSSAARARRRADHRDDRRRVEVVVVDRVAAQDEHRDVDDGEDEQQQQHGRVGEVVEVAGDDQRPSPARW